MESFEVFFEDVDRVNVDGVALTKWINACALSEEKKIHGLTIIFCSDEYLLKINREYLSHDYYTDIITFDLSDGETIEGELYVSLDRVRDNSAEINSPFKEELHRVIIHGVLHLIGYGDKSTEESKTMREKEEQYLSLLDL